MWESALSQETMRTASLLPPEEGWAENLLFRFVSVLPIFKERAISFSSGFSGSQADSVRRSASSLSPASLLASGQETAVGGRNASPRISSQSPRGLRDFCEDESEHDTTCTIQLYSPLLHQRGVEYIFIVRRIQTLLSGSHSAVL